MITNKIVRCQHFTLLHTDISEDQKRIGIVSSTIFHNVKISQQTIFGIINLLVNIYSSGKLYIITTHTKIESSENYLEHHNLPSLLFYIKIERTVFLLNIRIASFERSIVKDDCLNLLAK